MERGNTVAGISAGIPILFAGTHNRYSCAFTSTWLGVGHSAP